VQQTAVRIRRWNDNIKTDLKQYIYVCLCVCVCVCERERERHLLGSRELSNEPPRFTKCRKFRATAGRLSAALEWLLQGLRYFWDTCTVCQTTLTVVPSLCDCSLLILHCGTHYWLTDWLTANSPPLPAAASLPRCCKTTEQSVRLAVQPLLVFMTSFWSKVTITGVTNSVT
jgi:hypothetical protein